MSAETGATNVDLIDGYVVPLDPLEDLEGAIAANSRRTNK